ncbi:MAG TPA: signal peptidase II [Opitutaceae bacterium]|nr:signal peptidase II [Opitutaceae bacterium]
MSLQLSSVSPSNPVVNVSFGKRLKGYRWLIGLACSVLILDQLTKYAIIRHLPLGAYEPPYNIPVIPGFFNLVHVGNPGAAWSLFSGRNTMLAVLAVAALFSIFFWRRSLGLRQPIVQVSFGLLCGGIVGNLIDRLVHHHVVDFLDFHFGSYVYPTFNVADCGICIGVFLYLFYTLRNPT